MEWSQDEAKGSFQRAFKASAEAFQAFHEKLYTDMAQGIKKCSAAELAAQANILKTMFKEDWAPAEKKELEITNKNEAMSDKELSDQLRALLNSEHTRQYMKEIVEGGFKPNLKAIEKDSDD